MSFGRHKDKVDDILHEILDSKVYKKIIEEVQRGEVYFINS